MIRLLDYRGHSIKMHVTSRPEMDMRIRSVDKEKETVAFIETMAPHATFYDIGSNTGAYSLIAAARGLRVIAFEPAAPNYSRLVENVVLNQFPVTVLPFGLSEATDVKPFAYSSLEPGAALHSIGEGGSAAVLQGCFALDDLLALMPLPLPDYMKIDTDGHELPVLKGAESTLRGVRGLQVEIDPSIDEHSDIGPYLTDLGFGISARTVHEQSGVVNTLFERLNDARVL